MSDASAFGFGKFIPGFDFLQGLAKAGQGAAVPPVSSWIAPTVSVEELDKRIAELKAVQYWIEQNGRALAATVQALEVQKLTLSTLQGMNVSMSEVAKAFTGQTQQTQATSPSAEASADAAQTAAGAYADWPMSAAGKDASKKEAARAHADSSKATFGSKSDRDATDASAAKAADSDASQASSKPEGLADAAGPEQGGGAGVGADPLLWWSALTQQFQHIAAQALQDPAQQQAMAQATHMATDFTKAAMQAASDMVRTATSAAQAAQGEANTGADAASRKPVKPASAERTQAAKPAGKKAAAPKTTPKVTQAAASKAVAKPKSKPKPKPAPQATTRSPSGTARSSGTRRSTR